MQNEYVLEMKHISKQYGNNAVLSDVSLSVKPGEIHALLGAFFPKLPGRLLGIGVKIRLLRPGAELLVFIADGL